MLMGNLQEMILLLLSIELFHHSTHVTLTDVPSRRLNYPHVASWVMPNDFNTCLANRCWEFVSISPPSREKINQITTPRLVSRYGKFWKVFNLINQRQCEAINANSSKTWCRKFPIKTSARSTRRMFRTIYDACAAAAAAFAISPHIRFHVTLFEYNKVHLTKTNQTQLAGESFQQ